MLFFITFSPMSWIVPYKKYQYKLRIESLNDFYVILNSKFNINDTSGDLIRNIDKPFNFKIEDNKFKATKNVRYVGGYKGPMVFGEFDVDNSTLTLTIRYELYWIIIFFMFNLFQILYLSLDGTSIVRIIFGVSIFSGFIYFIGLINFHINEERFPMNFEKRFRNHIISKKIT